MFVASLYAPGVLGGTNKPSARGDERDSLTQTGDVGRDRQLSAAKSCNEIFYNLDAHRVLFDQATHYLYFASGPDSLLVQTIQSALRGMNSASVVEQMHLDPHRFFNGARRVKLSAPAAETVLVALRLAGVRAMVR